METTQSTVKLDLPFLPIDYSISQNDKKYKRLRLAQLQLIWCWLF